MQRQGRARRWARSLGRLRDWIPPNAVMVGSALLGHGIKFKGRYGTWEEARAHANGYEDASILERSLANAEALEEGRAKFERDGVLIADASPPFPLLAALMRAAARRHGRLDVLDFGGALGSTYFQCRRWLDGLAHVRWTIVEQAHYVAAGRSRMACKALAFASSIDEAVAQNRPDVAIFSSVLQYLPDPASVLRQVAKIPVADVIIDRTPFIAGSESIVTVQHVPARLVKSSYPAHLFALDELLEPLRADYEVLSVFDALDRSVFSLGRRIDFKGVALTRRRVQGS